MLLAAVAASCARHNPSCVNVAAILSYGESCGEALTAHKHSWDLGAASGPRRAQEKKPAFIS